MPKVGLVVDPKYAVLLQKGKSGAETDRNARLGMGRVSLLESHGDKWVRQARGVEEVRDRIWQVTWPRRERPNLP